MPLKYRPDIDGLRAIAVLAVLFFHTGVPGFSGGFVGVDIFFVISGFLITSIILKDIKEEQFSIARFYERRIRRIFPALFPVIAFTLAVGAYLFDANAFKDLGQSITATTLFSSNILFWRESGYFAAASFTKPLLHTWSLAVEEQFYIFFPLALVFIHRFLKSRYILWIGIAIILSLGASIWGVYYKPSPTFYLVPTRAWELLAGSVLALGVLPNPSSAWLRNLLSATGLGLIMYSVGFYTEATLFPGHNAIAPVMGAWLIIYSNRGGGTAIINKALSVKPLVFIGLISYSLYLWHWPLVAFAKYLMFRPFNGLESAGIIAASLAISTLSWKYIEQPFRGRQMVLPERKRLFAMSGIVMIAFAGIGGLIHLRSVMPGRIDWFYPEIKATFQRATQDSLWIQHREWEKTTEKIGKGAIPPIVGAENTTPSFALVGDSHARAIIPALEQCAQDAGVSGYMITKSGTPLLIGISKVSTRAGDHGFDEASHNDAVMAFLKSHSTVHAVFLVARWGAYIQGSWTEKNEDPSISKLIDASGEYSGPRFLEYTKDATNATILGIGLKRTVVALSGMGKKVILVSDVPEIGYNVPRVHMIESRFPMLMNGFDVRPTVPEYQARQKEANAILEELAKLPGVTLIHPETRMFDENGRGRIMANGELLYVDDHHLSTAGALFVAPVFDDVFKSMAPTQKRGDLKTSSRH